MSLLTQILRKFYEYIALISPQWMKFILLNLIEPPPIRKINKWDVLSGDMSSSAILKCLEGEGSLLISRLGTTETNVLMSMEKIKSSKFNFEPLAIELSNLSGVYPPSLRNLEKFGEIYAECISQVDIMGVRDLPTERFFWKNEIKALQKYFSGSAMISIEDLFPVHHRIPWTKHLAKRNVLIIHPFKKTIEKQIDYLNLIYPNAQIPKFSGLVIKPPQLLANSLERAMFEDWFCALEHTSNEIEKKLREHPQIEYALVAAGAMGLPLATKCKQLGLKVIHVGGALQLFFGILGKRWEGSDNIIDGVINKHWVRPDKSEAPRDSDLVEDSCYW